MAKPKDKRQKAHDAALVDLERAQKALDVLVNHAGNPHAFSGQTRLHIAFSALLLEIASRDADFEENVEPLTGKDLGKLIADMGPVGEP